jgi:hypothetical protein
VSKLVIEIRMDGAAFEDGADIEVRRILIEQLGPNLEGLIYQRPRVEQIALRDHNGNTVGSARFVAD